MFPIFSETQYLLSPLSNRPPEKQPNPHDDTETSNRLDGVDAIGKFLGISVRRVRYARETGSLPIRKVKGIGIYAFKTELLSAMTADGTLPGAAV